MKPYLQLTERGRVSRLRRLALNALKDYDLPVTRLRLVDNSCNGIFRIDTHTGEKWILRVTLPDGGHTLDHVTAETDWLASLARETNLSVLFPLAARDGSYVVVASAEGVPSLDSPSYALMVAFYPRFYYEAPQPAQDNGADTPAETPQT